MNGVHCEAISPDGLPCMHRPGHNGWHEWRETLSDDYATVTTWHTEFVTRPALITVESRSWYRRLWGWLDAPTAPRWFWVFVISVWIEWAADLAKWLAR